MCRKVSNFLYVFHKCLSAVPVVGGVRMKPRPLTELVIETEFLTMANASLGETWSARIRGKPLTQRPVLASLIVYLYNEGKGEMAYRPPGGQRPLEEIYGHTPEVTRATN